MPRGALCKPGKSLPLQPQGAWTVIYSCNGTAKSAGRRCGIKGGERAGHEPLERSSLVLRFVGAHSFSGFGGD